MPQLTEIVAALKDQRPPKRSNSPRLGDKKRFVWSGGCHECGGDHLKKDCDKWQAVLSKNHNNMPEGHVNAYSKARDAFNKKHGIVPKPRVKQGGGKLRQGPHAARGGRKPVNALMEGETDEDSDFSSDDSDTEHCGALRAFQVVAKGTKQLCVLQQPATKISNKFDPLRDGSCNVDGDDDNCNDGHLLELNKWAHKVNRASTRTSQKAPRKTHVNVVIRNEAELDAALAQNQQLCAALPGDRDRKKLKRMMRKAPPADELQEGEMWVMIDSGSGVDGLDADRDAPGIQRRKADNPIKCVTANGKTMDAADEVALTVELDGEKIDIPFSDLPLTMPILSVRKHVGRNHRCRIKSGGGYFRHNITKKKTRFIEKEGVYFMRMKVVGPSNPDKDDKNMDVGRPAAR